MTVTSKGTSVKERREGANAQAADADAALLLTAAELEGVTMCSRDACLQACATAGAAAPVGHARRRLRTRRGGPRAHSDPGGRPKQ